jgi:glutaredoxin
MSSVPPPRCSRHNLAVAPDGLCILCRRETSVAVVPAAAEPTSSASAWLLSAVLVLVAGGYCAWALVGARRAEPPPAAPVAVTVPREVETTKPAKPVEDDLTRSLRMLERAELERRALEQTREQSEQEQRAAAATQRQREEKERDAKRHEAVQRDLNALGLASARRSVSITMYSTTWCGFCKKARAYMQQQHIEFTDLDVDRDVAAAARQRALNPSGSVPTIAVDEEVLIGFSPDSLEDRINRAARRRTGS